jgi:hypothetical protein
MSIQENDKYVSLLLSNIMISVRTGTQTVHTMLKKTTSNLPTNGVAKPTNLFTLPGLCPFVCSSHTLILTKWTLILKGLNFIHHIHMNYLQCVAQQGKGNFTFNPAVILTAKPTAHIFRESNNIFLFCSLQFGSNFFFLQFWKVTLEQDLSLRSTC